MALLLASCYEPSKLVQPTSGGTDTTTTTVSGGVLRTINTGKQICNPSISPDTVHYPDAMLWLGFSGDLVVKDAPAGYITSNVVQHDRLTISNADNSVAWYMLKDTIPGAACELQDPEWSAHPDWIVTMGAYADNGKCDDGNPIYSGWIIRPYDNARFKFSQAGLDYISTPHAWLDASATAPDSAKVRDTVTYDDLGIATPASVQSYFGTNNVVFSWSKIESGYTIHYIDYSEASPQVRALAKPAGRETWKAESGLISPDGKWIAYNLYFRLDQYAAYVQELKPGSTPILIGDNVTDPHWWKHPTDPSRWFLVYATLASGQSYVLTADYSKVTSSTLGATWMQELRLSTGLPSDLAVEWIGSPRKISDLPFRGGRSPDGRFLATGTNIGYMMELP